MLGLLVVVSLLVFWALRSTDDSSPAGSGEDGGDPAPTITPGPSADESLIDERPGGREEHDGGSDDGAGEDTDDGDGDPEDEGSDGDGNGQGDGGAGDNGSGDKRSDDAAGLPDCTPGQLEVALRSAENSYPPDERPELHLTLRNTTARACAADVGHAALTIVISEGDQAVWNSGRCPAGEASVALRVPGDGTATHEVTWDRRHSPDDCDGGRGRAAATGTTYLAEATLDGFLTKQTSFRLDED